MSELRPVVSVVLAAVGAAARAAVVVGGLVAASDASGNLDLCSVPDASLDAPLVATVLCTEGGDSLVIDGNTIANGSTATFADIAAGRTYEICCDSGHKHSLAFTSLPIVQIDCVLGTAYNSGSLVLTMPGEAPEAMAARVKYRGGSTNSNYRHKRHLHVKFVDGDGAKMNRVLFGLRDDNSWLLDGGQIDVARVRNRVAMDLWRDFATKPYYFAEEPKAIGGTRGEYVEVFLNGAYFGFYSMGEAVDRKQLKLKKFDADTHEIKGLLWKTFAWTDPVMMYNAPSYDSSSGQWGGVEVKYPDTDDVLPTDWTVLADAVRFVATSSNDYFVAHVGEYFDVPVLEDYIIFTELLNAIDNTGKNIYWFVHDSRASHRLSLTAWDLDTTVGQFWTNDFDDAAGVAPTHSLVHNCLLFKRLLSLEPFKTQICERYWQLRGGALRLDSLVARYHTHISRLQRAGASQRETERWSGDTDLGGKALDFEAQKDFIAGWLAARLDYLDHGLFSVPIVIGDLNGDHVVDVDDLNLLINVLLRRRPADDGCDLNGDDIIDIEDVNVLIRLMSGKV